MKKKQKQHNNSPVFEGDVGEHHPKESHRSVDDRHAQRQRPRDGLAHKDTQVDGGRIVFKSATPRRTVGLQLQSN